MFRRYPLQATILALTVGCDSPPSQPEPESLSKEEYSKCLDEEDALRVAALTFGFQAREYRTAANRTREQSQALSISRHQISRYDTDGIASFNRRVTELNTSIRELNETADRLEAQQFEGLQRVAQLEQKCAALPVSMSVHKEVLRERKQRKNQR